MDEPMTIVRRAIRRYAEARPDWSAIIADWFLAALVVFLTLGGIYGACQ